MPNLRVTIQEFNKALTALNEKLANIDKTIEIKAIGGYAMMRAGLRDTEESPGFSEDIDSIAGRFSKQVYYADRRGWRRTGSTSGLVEY